MAAGEFELSQFLFLHSAAVTEHRQDAAPLRLILWLTFSLPPDLQKCIDELMDLYTCRPTLMLLSEVARRTLDDCPQLDSQKENKKLS